MTGGGGGHQEMNSKFKLTFCKASAFPAALSSSTRAGNLCPITWKGSNQVKVYKSQQKEKGDHVKRLLLVEGGDSLIYQDKNNMTTITTARTTTSLPNTFESIHSLIK